MASKPRTFHSYTLFVFQVDLGVPKTVRGMITQGARGLEGSTSAENRAFVRKYKVAHSLTGKEWTYITDSKTGYAKVKRRRCEVTMVTRVNNKNTY